VTGKPKISTSPRQVLPDIDLRQTRFRIGYILIVSIKILGLIDYLGMITDQR